MSNVYLALYKGRRSGKGLNVRLSQFSDWLTRKLTKGQYSHCELVVERDDGQFCCYSSSIRDGGVRQKIMPLPEEKWDLIPLDWNEEKAYKMALFFYQNKGKKYDWLGAVGVVLKCSQDKRKYFCSEFCAEAIGLAEPWRFSPNDLAAIFKNQ